MRPTLSLLRLSATCRPLILAGTLLALSGCAATKAMLQPRIALKEVTFDVSAKANDATPFSVALVAVSDEALLPPLLALTAAQWFDPATNFERDHPGVVRVWSYELAPGPSQPVKDVPFNSRGTRAVLLFANYKAKGAHRLRLDKAPRALVRFSDKTIELAGQP